MELLDRLKDRQLETLLKAVRGEMDKRGASAAMELVTSPSRAIREDFELWGDGSDLVPDELRISECTCGHSTGCCHGREEE